MFHCSMNSMDMFVSDPIFYRQEIWVKFSLSPFNVEPRVWSVFLGNWINLRFYWSLNTTRSVLNFVTEEEQLAPSRAKHQRQITQAFDQNIPLKYFLQKKWTFFIHLGITTHNLKLTYLTNKTFKDCFQKLIEIWPICLDDRWVEQGPTLTLCMCFFTPKC